MRRIRITGLEGHQKRGQGFENLDGRDAFKKGMRLGSMDVNEYPV
jgi:hypothetical protein